MSARVQSRRPTSKRRLSEGSSSTRKAVRDLDLNRHPDGGGGGGASASAAEGDPLLLPPPLQQPPVPCPPAAAPAVQPPSNGGDQTIVIPDEDDDIMVLSSSTNPSQVRAPPTIPVILIDEDSDVQHDHSQSGVIVQEPVSTLALYGYGISERNPRKRLIINCEEYESRRYIPCSKVVETVQLLEVEPPPPPPPPKEPLFNCSVCLGELDQATSTICGHIFCQKCIKAAVQRQKKCPTCRRKLTDKNIHRVYLPTTK